MKTQRRNDIIQSAGKVIGEKSIGSDCTDYSDSDSSLPDIKKVDMDSNLDSLSTKFTNLTSDENIQQISLNTTHIDMMLEDAPGFSIDNIMTSDKTTTHSLVVKEYGRDIINNLKRTQITLVSNLSNHEINGDHRKQMVVWMEEVLTTFKGPTSTFFLAVSIMDRYFEGSKTKLVLDELHEIGITGMFIASKYSEVEPLTLELMINKVAHGKFSDKALLQREKKILCTLKFRLAKPLILEFIESYTELFSERFESDEAKLQVMEEAINISKNGILDQQIAFSVLPSEIALCSLIIAIKDYSRFTKTVILDDSFSQAIKNELNSDESIVLQFGKKLRKLAIERIF